MTKHLKLNINPKLDLAYERTSHLSTKQIWQGWTHPETLMKWFCPRPWKVTECRINLHPGGEFFTHMQGPNGEQMPNHGCFLEVIKDEKLVWTNMMTEGYRPVAFASPGFPFVGTILLTKTETGTLYQAIVQHGDEASRKQHEQMGFQDGWGMAFDQLTELFK